MYREPAGHAPERLRTVTIDEVDHEIFPHDFGRHRCPYCGAGRALFFVFFRPELGNGRFISLSDKREKGKRVAVQPMLKRRCGACEAIWYVETLWEK